MKQLPGSATACGPSPSPPLKDMSLPMAQQPNTYLQMNPFGPPFAASQQPHSCKGESWRESRWVSPLSRAASPGIARARAVGE